MQDLNYQIIKDKNHRKILRKIVYSRVILAFLMIAIQISLFSFFIIELNSFFEFYLSGSLVISLSFIIYLANCKGKSEFKLAWILPLLFMPIVGVFMYISFHSSPGNHRIKKRIKYLNDILFPLAKKSQNSKEIYKLFPEIQGVSNYLVNSGNYFSFMNSKICYYKNGEIFLPEFLNSIKNAKKFIFMEFFIIEVDETWALILEILEQKVSEGVEVRLLYDGVGSIMASTKKYQKYLREKGIKAQVFIPLIPFFSSTLNNRDHRKIVIIDGKISFTGGINLSNVYFNLEQQKFNYWKDNVIKVEGSAITNYMSMFLQTWNLGRKVDDNYSKYFLQIQQNDFKDEFNENFTNSTKNSLENGVVIPYGDDFYNQQNIAENIYLHIINNSKKYLYITSPYIIIDNEIQEALIFAVQRGVCVKIILPSVPDHFITFCVGKTFLNTLVQNGVNIFLYKKGFIHSKTFISDDEISTIGSINLDYRSLLHHFESNTLIFKSKVINEIKQDFEETLEDCEQMDLNSYKKLPKKIRFFGRLFRIFSPLM